MAVIIIYITISLTLDSMTIAFLVINTIIINMIPTTVGPSVNILLLSPRSRVASVICVIYSL